MGDRTKVPYDTSINHPETVDELSKELKQQVEAKFNVVLRASLQKISETRSPITRSLILVS
jgi:hypothetical protein